MIPLLIVLLFQIPSLAAMTSPATTVQSLHVGGKTEDALRVSTARVVVADYELIRQDFPQTALLSEKEIDEWLLEEAAYISRSQAKANAVNTFIHTLKGKIKKVFRPNGYGRAWVTNVTGGGMIDAKGGGARFPSQKSHGNGLSTTGEALREYLFEKMTQKALRAGGADASTVGSYAVIDYGFDVIHADGTKSPAGAYLRQAHERLGHLTQLNPRRAFSLEAVLRRFGITTAGDLRTSLFEALNVQTASSGDLVDFGAFLAPPDFHLPATIYLNPRTLSARIEEAEAVKAITVMEPGTPSFVQAEENIRAPLDQWGAGANFDPKFDRMWARMHELADSLQRGETSLEQIRNELGAYLHTIDARFSQALIAAPPQWVSVFARVNNRLESGKINPSQAKFLLERIALQGRGMEITDDDLPALRKMTEDHYPADLRQVAGRLLDSHVKASRAPHPFECAKGFGLLK